MANHQVKAHQMTVVWHVDNLKILHMLANFTNMKNCISQDDLGMDFDFSEKGKVNLSER